MSHVTGSRLCSVHQDVNPRHFSEYRDPVDRAIALLIVIPLGKLDPNSGVVPVQGPGCKLPQGNGCHIVSLAWDSTFLRVGSA